jgi:molybdopterin-guanine dinucleotide biosynthesis protein A
MLLVGIFVGGAATRMGGIAKGRLATPGSQRTIVERLVQLARARGEAVWVGRSDAYASLGLEALADEPAGIGPLGGLNALLVEGARRGADAVVALACDLPYVSEALFERLLTHAPEADALAPKQDGKWQPLFARYRPAPALAAAEAALAAGERALFSVLRRLGERAVELPLSESEAAELADWDEPGDVHS